MKPDKFQLLAMLRYMRAEGSVGQEQFCERFLQPVFGDPDEHGNYSLVVGGVPRIAFMAHHDTVHNSYTQAKQKVNVFTNRDGIEVAYSNSNCLGADCTTGCWLILHMIKNQVPGLYVIHSQEEVGGQGSERFCDENAKLLSTVEIAISLDRKGTTSIITHQMYGRTASDTFASELAAALGGTFIADNTGTFTDSANYAKDISECTNLSVGYYHQHTKHEYQDVTFAMDLANKLVAADWSTVHAHRDQTVVEDDDWYADYRYPVRTGYGTAGHYYTSLGKVVANNPEDVADILAEYGYNAITLMDEIIKTRLKATTGYNGQKSRLLLPPPEAA